MSFFVIYKLVQHFHLPNELSSQGFSPLKQIHQAEKAKTEIKEFIFHKKPNFETKSQIWLIEKK
jgi:hypothetical protein